MPALPIILSSLQEVRQWRRSVKGRVGFVPTMGALHEGHATLLKKVRPRCDTSVLSIFVNPSQFAPHEDLSKYPKTFESDLAIAAREGVDVVFAPTPDVIYPSGYSTYVDEEKISKPLCGQFRPGHFRGVATVVLKLLNLIQPELALFGLKDAQQFFVIQKMVKDLNLDVIIEGVDTVREPDGLALSSRNVYMSPEERKIAPLLYKVLQSTAETLSRSHHLGVSIIDALNSSIELLQATGFIVQYLSCLELPELQENSLCPKDDRPYLLATACYLGKTRLIDNIMIRPRLLDGAFFH